MVDTKRDFSEYLEVLRSQLPIVKEQYGVETLEVFGSFVRADENEKSDLDLLVTFSKTPGLFSFIALANHLTDTLGIKVDLVMKEALKPAIGERILSETVTV